MEIDAKSTFYKKPKNRGKSTHFRLTSNNDWVIFQYFTFLVINRTLFSIKSKSVNNPPTPYFRTFVCFDFSNLVSWDICSTFYPLLCHFCQLFSFELSESYINSAPFCETKKGDLCIFLRITNLSTAKGVMLFAHKRGKMRPLLTYAFSTNPNPNPNPNPTLTSTLETK